MWHWPVIVFLKIILLSGSFCFFLFICQSLCVVTRVNLRCNLSAKVYKPDISVACVRALMTTAYFFFFFKLNPWKPGSGWRRKRKKNLTGNGRAAKVSIPNPFPLSKKRVFWPSLRNASPSWAMFKYLRKAAANLHAACSLSLSGSQHSKRRSMTGKSRTCQASPCSSPCLNGDRET